MKLRVAKKISFGSLRPRRRSTLDRAYHRWRTHGFRMLRLVYRAGQELARSNL